MKSITLHKLDDTIENLIKKRAKKNGTSLNKTIQSILKESLGITRKSEEGNKEYFLDLFGVWSNDDYKEFNKNINDLNKIDKRDWKWIRYFSIQMLIVIS